MRQALLDLDLTLSSADASTVEALIDAADENHGVVPPLAMVAAFPGRPELHTDTRIREALLLAGCDEA
jgi:hypothetical protein